MSLADSALILAGGKSSRMGYDKKNLELNGERVFGRLLAELRSLFGEVLVSSNDNGNSGPFGVPVLRDEIGGGPLAGIYQGLRRCSSAYLYVTACDMPFISGDYIAYMRELLARESCDVCLARREDGLYEPFNAFYSASCEAPVREALLKGEYKISMVLDRLRLRVIGAETTRRFGGGAMFFNINRAEDLERAVQIPFS
ncbi:MAG: molybdenum cofactor guanylyltransferase [Treponema sp.]|nr:molybdenum cofactor guanylyltransferase [Treponema sp.]